MCLNKKPTDGGFFVYFVKGKRKTYPGSGRTRPDSNWLWQNKIKPGADPTRFELAISSVTRKRVNQATLRVRSRFYFVLPLFR